MNTLVRIKIWQGNGLWLTATTNALNFSNDEKVKEFVERSLPGKKGFFDVEVRDYTDRFTHFKVNID